MSECQMIPFPLKARVAKVRRVAEVYQRKDGNDRKAYWRSEINRLGDQLEVLGIDEAHIDAQLDEFKRAVQAEINRRYLVGSNNKGDNPKGAA
ncbi:hypothetical protein ATY75_03270 [Rhizobium sp. N122]|uniref:DUF6074 family protein n=1 Tax=Rhizobium sp. N122 TaxID=1764272 RepID=UPI000B5A822A|nr:DUF6074 family protein [Rhizobium sp. N122]OWV87344.1 hypothetical protein ATY75_03270 [Rhizobium sp. N122]